MSCLKTLQILLTKCPSRASLFVFRWHKCCNSVARIGLKNPRGEVKVMNSLIRNSILFLSGFIVAVVMYNSPINTKNKNYLTDEASNFYNDSYETKSDLNQNLHPNKKTTITSNLTADISKKSFRSKPSARRTYNDFAFASGRQSLDAVPDMPIGSEGQVPSEPPTGRPTPEDQAQEDEKAEDTTSDQVQTALNNQDKGLDDYNRNSKGSSDSEKSLSSNMPQVAFIGSNTNSTSVEETSSKSSSGGGGFGGGRGRRQSNNDDNAALETLPSDFTSSGLQIARRLYTNGEMTESEYLDYISMGLSSSDLALQTLAINELVGLKTKSAFALQTEFANSSTTNSAVLNQAIAGSYRTAADLRFLGQIIADNSSVETQEWAIYSLDIVISSSNMDFANPQIREILVQNISTSLVKLDSNHPAFEEAQDISRDINNRLT